MQFNTNELNRLSFREFINACKGYEIKQRQSWEQVRFLATVIAQANSTKKIRPKDLIEFTWETTKEITLAPEEIQKEWDEVIKDHQERLKNIKRKENK